MFLAFSDSDWVARLNLDEASTQMGSDGSGLVGEVGSGVFGVSGLCTSSVKSIISFSGSKAAGGIVVAPGAGGVAVGRNVAGNSVTPDLDVVAAASDVDGKAVAPGCGPSGLSVTPTAGMKVTPVLRSIGIAPAVGGTSVTPETGVASGVFCSPSCLSSCSEEGDFVE